MTKVCLYYFLLLMYCLLGFMYFRVEYWSFLKIGSSIKQRFCGLEVTISQPSLPARSTWQVFWMRVQMCTSQPTYNLRGRPSRKLHDLYTLHCNYPLFIYQQTHTQWWGVARGFYIRVEQTLEMWKEWRYWSQAFVWKERDFSLRKTIASILSFPSLSLH